MGHSIFKLKSTSFYIFFIGILISKTIGDDNDAQNRISIQDSIDKSALQNLITSDSSQPETTTTNGSATISQFWSFLNENSTEEIPSNSLNETEISFEETTTESYDEYSTTFEDSEIVTEISPKQIFAQFSPQENNNVPLNRTRSTNGFGSFGKPDDETNCQEREVIYDDVIYDEKMQCQKVVEKKCFQVQETTFNIYKTEVCDDVYAKNCFITLLPDNSQVIVEVCHNRAGKLCDEAKTSVAEKGREGDDSSCVEVFETICETIYRDQVVEEDQVTCTQVKNEVCNDAGSCITVPQTSCSIAKNNVTKNFPETECKKVKKSICGPNDCPIRFFPEVCKNETKVASSSTPIEKCELTPKKECRDVSTLVPSLLAVEKCMDIPKEVCIKVEEPRMVQKTLKRLFCETTTVSPPTTHTRETCHEFNMDYTGNNIKQVDNIADPSICQTQCQVTVGCKFYVFSKSLNRCFLKDIVARKVPNSDGIIGPRTCPGKCFEEGVDSAGNDIKDLRVASIEECQAECKKLFNCKLFVYAPSIKNCWLKSAFATRTINTDRIVGPRVCTADCFQEGRDFPGNEIAVVPSISSPYFCLLECKKRSDCIFYSYNMNTNVCSLKNNNGRPKISSVTVSGSVVCEPREYCFDTGTVYTGSDIGSLVVKSAYQCQIECQNKLACTSFSYDLKTNICWMKNGIASKNKKETYVSGPRKCYEGMCSTTTYTKSNGALACGYDIQSGLSWYQARNECTENGARLPEIADARENNEIYIRMYPDSRGHFLGATDLQTEGTFTWESTKTKANYTNWERGEPGGWTSENCLIFWANSPFWHDVGCEYSTPNQQLCERILHGVA